MSERVAAPTAPRKPRPYAMLAEFAAPADIYHAAQKTRAAGYKWFDCCVPFPVHGLDKAMGVRPTILPVLVFFGGLTGTTIAVLRVKDDVIVLQTMMWPDEIRTPEFTVESGEVKDSEVKMANMLVETLAGDFDVSDFEDVYAEAVQALVKAKIEGGEIKRTPTSTKSSGEVVDLLAALQKSVEAAKSARGESSSSDDA